MTALTSQPPVLPVRTIRLHRPLIAIVTETAISGRCKRMVRTGRTGGWDVSAVIHRSSAPPCGEAGVAAPRSRWGWTHPGSALIEVCCSVGLPAVVRQQDGHRHAG